MFLEVPLVIASRVLITRVLFAWSEWVQGECLEWMLWLPKNIHRRAPDRYINIHNELGVRADLVLLIKLS